MSLQEDEKEVLAHIVQNIDEQEIFLEFVAKAETIKEAWQIAKIFENKKKEFIEHIQEYDALIKVKEKQLKSLTDEITEANTLLKDANNELEHIRAQLEEMQSKAQLYKNKIAQGRQSEQMENFDMQTKFMLAKEDSDLPILDFSNIIANFEPLQVVSVHVKNGATAMARAAQIIYPEELYEAYMRAGKRLFRLKDRIGELELNNEKLRVELRDLTEEDNFKEHMLSKMGGMPMNDIEMKGMRMGSITKAQEDYKPVSKTTTLESKNAPFESKIPKQKDSTLTLHLDSKEEAERIARIEKKKEKVEEMLQQLSHVLREEGINTKSTDAFLEAFQARNKK